MRKTCYALLMAAFSLSACAGDPSLQGVFEAQMKDDGYAGYDIIHIEENQGDGWVLYTSWTDDYPDNRNRPGVGYFQLEDDQWQSAMGTACSSNGVSTLGLMGNGYLYCSVLRPDMQFESISAGRSDAQIFTFNGTMTVWVAIASEFGASVVGTTSDGREVSLN